jgi:type IV pilus assembly protein PilC
MNKMKEYISKINSEIKELTKKYNKVSIKSSKKSFSYFKNATYSRMSTKDQTFFVKRLSFLIKAGIPVLDSLAMIKDQTKKKSYSKILDKIIADVANGQNLSNSLAKFPGMFSEFSVNIIGFGESSGILSENLEYLADELKKKQQLKKKVVGAFVYPIVVTFATFGITGFLMVYLFPKIMPVFQSLHMKLPLSTRLVIFLSNFIRFNGLYIFGGLVFLTLGFLYLLKKNKTFRFYFDKSVLKIPLIGDILRDYNLANSTRTIGLLLKGGVTVSEAIPIAEKTSSNLVYKEEFKKLSESINRGDKISLYLSSRPDLFPEVLSQIVSVGERSGNLSNSLIYLSELYEAQVDDFTKNLSNLIEPALMIFMGILVGFIAISIITPIYSITQNLHG